MQIDASEKSLDQLFSGNSTFTIPDYQRNYAWKSDQIDAFLNDVLGMIEDDDASQHFFGPIVVLEPQAGELSVVDGQQRLTTTVMFLAILRDLIANLKDNKYQVGDQTLDLNFLIVRLLKHSNFADDRFVANYQIRQIFKSYVLATPGAPNRKKMTATGLGMTPTEKTATSELRSAYMRIDRALRNWLSDIAGDEGAMKERLYGLLHSLTNDFRLLEIKMFSEEDAYTLFETLNDRGLRLTPSDILKSYTLQLARQSDEAEITDVLNRWDTAVQTLGDFPFTKFLRHYLLSKQPQKVQAKTILRHFKELIQDYDKDGENGALRNLTELEEASNTYAILLGETSTHPDPEVAQAISRINLISETHRVFLLPVISSGFSEETVRRAVRGTEALAFRWILTGGNAQEIETHYQGAAMMLKAGDDSSAEVALDFLMSKLPADDIVTTTMSTGASRKDLQMYVMRKLHLGMTGSELSFPANNLSIDLLAPPKPGPGSPWFIDVAPASSNNPDVRVYQDYVGKWGNVAIIEFAMRPIKRNADWNVKVKTTNMVLGLEDSQIPLTEQLTNREKWTGEAIDQRSEWMAVALTKLTFRETIDDPHVKIDPFL